VQQQAVMTLHFTPPGYPPSSQHTMDVVKVEPNSDTVTNQTSCHSGFNFTETQQQQEMDSDGEVNFILSCVKVQQW
jgi:hypothetical protein